MTPGPPPQEGASTTSDGGDVRAAFLARCDAIEEAYEFMLAYAAQGVANEQGSASGGQIRAYLQRCDAALDGLAGVLTECVQRLAGCEPAGPYQAVIDVLDRDSRDAKALVELVLAQPSIGSQTVDNLNASIHLRALLTDLFLIDEVLKSKP